ncbi:MAG: penicillin-binding protein 1C [Nitrospirae bacterium GWC2_42_7]|nr:MAG: penicillin-binding protein 1C [Nitrospirae bacterium GWC2_42_7]
MSGKHNKEFISKAPSPSRGDNAPAFGTPSLKITPPGSASPPLKIRGGKGGVMISGRGKGELISHPLRGGPACPVGRDEGEGDVCGFTIENISGCKLAGVLLCIMLFFPFSLCDAKEVSFEKEALVLPDNTIFLDRNGKPLRFIPDEKWERHIWISGRDIPDIVRNAFIAVEDERFYEHSGFDLKAIFRAMKDNIFQGRIVSGASTISQQVVRLIYPHKRTLGGKVTEIFRSLRLESSLSKDEILEHYLNRVPMGNNITGVELASRIYFGKPASDLSVAEAALLASIPKAPGRLDPFSKDNSRLMERKELVLRKMLYQGHISEEEFNEAENYKIILTNKDSFPFNASHLVEMLIKRGYKLPGVVHTTIDLNLQQEIEKILLSQRERLAFRGASQAAVLVVHNPTMEVLASAGSISYSDKYSGFINGTTALRSAGSTIKPLLYAQALEEGYTVSSLLEDTLRKYRTPLGNYSPDNYDRKEYGPVTMRVALGSSLNISAIKMIDSIQVEPVYQTLRRLELLKPGKGPEHYGLGIVIGNVEVSLEQLVAVYAMLANQGVFRKPRYTVDDLDGPSEQIFSPETSFIISDILSDASARMLTFGNSPNMTFPFRVSLKTGTSTKYRDGWIVGYTPEYTVGVWIGNFDGRPTAKLSGASGAAPIFKDIIYLLHENSPPSLQKMPENVVTSNVCGISGKKPGEYCHYVTAELFIKGTEPVDTCDFHDNDGYFHELPTSYAGWLYDKKRKVSAGAYRLRGFPKNLDEVFSDDMSDSGDIGIRVNSDRESQGISSDVAKNTVKTPVSQKHLTIGSVNSIDEIKTTLDNNSISIIYPLPGDRFVKDRRSDMQAIQLESLSLKPVDYVDWYIDGKHYARTGPPYNTFWKLKKGAHNIAAVLPDKTGDSVDIIVE